MKTTLRNALFLLTVLPLAAWVQAAPNADKTESSVQASDAATAPPAKKAKPKRKHHKVDVSPMGQTDSMAVPIGPTPPAGTSPGGPGTLQ